MVTARESSLRAAKRTIAMRRGSKGTRSAGPRSARFALQAVPRAAASVKAAGTPIMTALMAKYNSPRLQPKWVAH